MSEDQPRPESADRPKPETKSGKSADARAVEAAAARRRWITLGEVLGVLAVVISGLTLWNNWSQRNDSDAVKVADAQRASARATTLVLLATGAGERALTLKPASSDQSVQSQTVLFPSALGVAPAETTGESRIESKWFERELVKARNEARLPDDSRGDERLPVVITTRFLVDGEAHEDVALYDVGYGISGGWLGGHSVALRGISLVARVKATAAQARLDARWRQLMPKGSK